MPHRGRQTTQNTAAILRNLGMTGGQGFADIADTPLIPTVQVQDLSKTFLTETVEPRAIATSIVTYTLGVALSIPIFQLLSLGEGGVVIDDLRLEALTLGNGSVFPGVPEGSWVVVSSRDPSTGLDPRYPVTGGPTNVVNQGGANVRSVITIGHRDLPSNFGVFLPPLFQLQPSTRWFVPAGYDLTFQMNSGSDGAGNDPLGFAQISWREVTGAGTGGFVRG